MMAPFRMAISMRFLIDNDDASKLVEPARSGCWGVLDKWWEWPTSLPKRAGWSACRLRRWRPMEPSVHQIDADPSSDVLQGLLFVVVHLVSARLDSSHSVPLRFTQATA